MAKIYGGKRASLVCTHAGTRTSNPYADYESRNSSVSKPAKLSSPNGQIPASVLMLLIERSPGPIRTELDQSAKEQQHLIPLQPLTNSEE